jgi:HTH-type transcriptional regulator/antitoxin HipB
MEQIARTADQIGAALRRRRRNLNLTQAALSTRTRRRQATISRLENGEPKTQLQTLVDVLAALDLELVIRVRTKADIGTIEDIF